MSKSNQPTQLSRVRSFVGVHGPVGFTLAGIAESLGISQTAASARLRDLRAEGFEVKVTNKRGLNGKAQVTYTTSQHPVNPARTATVKGVELPAAPAKDVSEAALLKVAKAAVGEYAVNGGRLDVVKAIAAYLA